MTAVVPVLATKFARSWPDHERGDPAEYVTTREAFSRRFTSDAHFAAYSVPEIARRLNVRALPHPDVLADGVRMALLVFDVDNADAHAGTIDEAPDAWWTAQRDRLCALLANHPGAFVYRTRGGYRCVYAAPRIVLRTDEDAAAWKRLYVGSVRYLAERYAIEADAACADWTRLYRLPFVRRDGTCEERETLGDASSLGAWTYAPPRAPEPAARPRVAMTSSVTDAYQRGALRSAVARVAGAPEGQRNPTLNAEAWSLARLGLAADVIAEALEPAARAAGLTRREIAATLRSATAQGATAPPRTIELAPPVVRSFLDAALSMTGRLLGSAHDRNRASCPACGRDDAVSYAPRDAGELGAFACACGARRDRVLELLPPSVKARASRLYPRALRGAVYRAAKARAERFAR